jgi:hypothetical protein
MWRNLKDILCILSPQLWELSGRQLYLTFEDQSGKELARGHTASHGGSMVQIQAVSFRVLPFKQPAPLAPKILNYQQSKTSFEWKHEWTMTK